MTGHTLSIASLLAELEELREVNTDMLAALERLERELNEAVSYAVDMREPWGHLRDMRDAARAAIKKARARFPQEGTNDGN